MTRLFATRRGPTVLVALATVTTAVCLTACSKDMAHAPEPVSPELQALYRTVRECRHDYERGIELILQGREAAGRDVLVASSDRLRVAARTCAITPGCDTGLFDDTLVHVFRDRSESLPSPDDFDWDRDPVEVAEQDESPFIEAIPEMGRTLDLLHGRDLRELIPWNDRVKAALDDWLTWKRPRLIQAYENYQYMRDKIEPIYARAGLPEALLFAMLAKESGGKVHAYSSMGAAGLLQFMPHTALSYGLGSDDGFDLRLDPVASTRANVAYLRDQFKTFNNDLEKVLAAYNVGPTKLRRLNRKHQGADFWDPRLYNSLPRETRHYVPQVLAAAWLFLHADDYGLHFPQLENATSVITLSEAMSLGELTICLGDDRNPEGWYRTLRNLNPRVDSTDRLPSGTRLELPSMLVPLYAEQCAGSSPLLQRARELHEARYPDDLARPRASSTARVSSGPGGRS